MSNEQKGEIISASTFNNRREVQKPAEETPSAVSPTLSEEDWEKLYLDWRTHAKFSRKFTALQKALLHARAWRGDQEARAKIIEEMRTKIVPGPTKREEASTPSQEEKTDQAGRFFSDQVLLDACVSLFGSQVHRVRQLPLFSKLSNGEQQNIAAERVKAETARVWNVTLSDEELTVLKIIWAMENIELIPQTPELVEDGTSKEK
jgi:hypothetical protein